MNQTRMPFGKHKGTCISNVPTSYLEWALETVDLSRYGPWLVRAIEEELDSRDIFNDTHHRQYQPGSQQTLALGQSIESWYRSLCMTYHPDRGGSHEAMKAITDAYTRLKKILPQ